MLIAFRSKSSADFYMLSQHAAPLLIMLGKAQHMDDAAIKQGIIRSDEVLALREQLAAQLDQAAAPSAAPQTDSTALAEPAAALDQAVGLKQRAWPLLEMLRVAGLKKHDVTWGV